MSMDKYFAFRKLMEFVALKYEVVDAVMNNYVGDGEIHGKDESGATITIRFTMKEEENNGN